MKFKQLLKKAEGMFNAAKREEEVKKKSLRKLISKLETYEKEKQEKLVDETDPERQQNIKQKIQVAIAQRKKGESILKEMEDTDKSS